MKWFDLFIAFLFIVFAGVQLNDPDPMAWVLMYSCVAVLWIFSAFNRYYQWLIYAGLLIATVWMLTLLPDFVAWLRGGADSIVGSMKAEEPHIELTREFLGLLLILLSLMVLRRKSIKNKNISTE